MKNLQQSLLLLTARQNTQRQTNTLIKANEKRYIIKSSKINKPN